ncbi:type VI secretion system Vgr family protein [Taylorella equigenitalis]|uniref:Rhs element Vgr protein n=1 Tax=Taylorella equigenitalis ATCC 35865 TaxID=743973 RepID=A0ABM5N8N6_9BURK|nr:type VI secretion system tip protein TssI/VgrG [Taylorella equigenitalis]AFN35213.1 hypothetical protein KUI_0111 [Taylorella equigenitalis ATCC 35865]ASY38657.1 type VI secretion protein VgrG [Taylorella equigenitalis]WDU54957.1 type VI secretion system tip protein VgrG [Taylorella equigenitalis]VEG30244.1 Uncharacterized protein conserved in bacteria [Taylorella equigenitalis ATCC 35865]
MADRHAIAHVAIPSLQFLSLNGHESLSNLYEFEVELASMDHFIDVRKMLGTQLTVEIESFMSAPRYLTGRVRKFELVGTDQDGSEYLVYKASVVPPLWYLTQGKDYKIFQDKKIEDIIKEVLDKFEIKYEFKLSGSYRNWEYVVQYDESPFNFVSRLMEHEGMYYWFKHDKNESTMIIADDASAHEEFPSYEVLNYLSSGFKIFDSREVITSWRHNAVVTPSKYTVVDFDFRKPSFALDTDKENQLDGDDSIEVYEWQGGYQELSDGDNYTKLRLEELKVPQEIVEADSNIRGICPGYKFTLANHPRVAENQGYVVVSAHYMIQVNGYSSNSGRQDFFSTSFYSLPASIQFRAARRSPEPKTHGPQTATVVGPSGEVIYTDKYGRVKVQFHWDRDGKKDENSSCWVRVSSPWASTGFGGLQIPRIGDEVVIDFIGGNPDRPLIIGRVYNEDNQPLVNLPDDSHTSGFRTRTIQGGSDNQNFLLFRDKQGDELVDIQAEKDMKIFVKNDFYLTVGNCG